MRVSVLTPDLVRKLQCALDPMLPSGMGAFADGIKDPESPSEYPEEEESLANAVSKRRNEFIAGRRCARQALARIGVTPCMLVPDENRVPVWPTGVVGSISHSLGLCCAVAARSSTITCLGVDLEMTTRISEGVIERVVHPMEADVVGNDPMLGSLLFSAKEAFFKAQFLTWGVWPNFSDLAFQLDFLAGQLRVVKLANNLPSDLSSAARKMQFHYTFFDNYVLTLCFLRTDD